VRPGPQVVDKGRPSSNVSYSHQLVTGGPRIAVAAAVAGGANQANGSFVPAGFRTTRRHGFSIPIPVTVLTLVASSPESAEGSISPLLRLVSARRHQLGRPVGGAVFAVAASCAKAAELSILPISRLRSAGGKGFTRPIRVAVDASVLASSE